MAEEGFDGVRDKAEKEDDKEEEEDGPGRIGVFEFGFGLGFGFGFGEFSVGIRGAEPKQLRRPPVMCSDMFSLDNDATNFKPEIVDEQRCLFLCQGFYGEKKGPRGTEGGEEEVI